MIFQRTVGEVSLLNSPGLNIFDLEGNERVFLNDLMTDERVVDDCRLKCRGVQACPKK